MFKIKIKKTIISFIVFNILLLPITAFASTYINSEAEEKESVNEKIVYLTFDDGPGGDVTKKVLDILKKENVPATFFVIGCQIKGQEDIILRMKNEGHSIGLHSYSHDRNKLYCSNENFLEEMKKCQDTLYEVTGEKYKILRFPFGCNNQSYKLTQKLVDSIHDNNLKIYDWTVDSGDGANYKSSPETLIKKSCKEEDNAVILMHCGYINKNSAEALTSIIKYYKNKGYTFKSIDETTPEVYKVTKK